MYYNLVSFGVLCSAVILSENYFSYELRCLLVVFWTINLVRVFFNNKKEKFIFTFLTVVFLLPFGPRDELALQSGELTSFVNSINANRRVSIKYSFNADIRDDATIEII